MRAPTRILVFLLVVLPVLLGTALAARAWLIRQENALRDSLISEKRELIDAALSATAPGGIDAALGPETLRRIEAFAGVTIGAASTNAAEEAVPGRLAFDYDRGADAQQEGAAVLHVAFDVPASARLILNNRQLVTAAILAGPAAVALLAGALLIGTSRTGSTRSPFNPVQKSDHRSLQQLARATVERGEALDRERDVRRRAEEDVALKQSLLTQALEEKIRLGRDLHDGIIQSLYAVGLTLESIRGREDPDPDERERRLEGCLENLNRTIRDIRSYIGGLSPENLRSTGFARALETLLSEFRNGREVAFEVRSDEDVYLHMTDSQGAHVIQIVREAVSNGLRHGGASRIELEFRNDKAGIRLSIADNGSGFDPQTALQGNGLGNMRARAAELGGVLEIEHPESGGIRLGVHIPLENGRTG